MYNSRVMQQVLRHRAPPSPLILACTYTRAHTRTYTLYRYLAISFLPCRPPVFYPFCASFIKPRLVLTHVGRTSAVCVTQNVCMVLCGKVCVPCMHVCLHLQNACTHIFAGVRSSVCVGGPSICVPKRGNLIMHLQWC